MALHNTATNSFHSLVCCHVLWFFAALVLSFMCRAHHTVAALSSSDSNLFCGVQLQTLFPCVSVFYLGADLFFKSCPAVDKVYLPSLDISASLPLECPWHAGLGASGYD